MGSFFFEIRLTFAGRWSLVQEHVTGRVGKDSHRASDSNAKKRLEVCVAGGPTWEFGSDLGSSRELDKNFSHVKKKGTAGMKVLYLR